MKSSDLLSTEELIEEARKRGLEVSERTVKFYVSHELLPKPQRDRTGARDRRVAYFPSSAVRAIEEIRRLQGKGFTLEQIRKFLTGADDPHLRSLAEEQRRSGRFRLAEGFVRALFSDTSREASRRFLDAALRDPSEEGLRAAGKDYYRAILSALMGEEEAQTYIAEVLERLTPREWEKKLAPLRQMRDGALRNMQEAARGSVGASLTSHLRALGEGFLAGAADGDAVLGDLADLERRLQAMGAKYEGVPPEDSQRYEIAVFMRRALAIYRESAALLKSSVAAPERATVEAALARAEAAGGIMGHLEAMVREKRELLRLCQEEDLRLT